MNWWEIIKATWEIGFVIGCLLSLVFGSGIRRWWLVRKQFGGPIFARRCKYRFSDGHRCMVHGEHEHHWHWRLE